MPEAGTSGLPLDVIRHIIGRAVDAVDHGTAGRRIRGSRLGGRWRRRRPQAACVEAGAREAECEITIARLGRDHRGVARATGAPCLGAALEVIEEERTAAPPLPAEHELPRMARRIRCRRERTLLARGVAGLVAAFEVVELGTRLAEGGVVEAVGIRQDISLPERDQARRIDDGGGEAAQREAHCEITIARFGRDRRGVARAPGLPCVEAALVVIGGERIAAPLLPAEHELRRMASRIRCRRERTLLARDGTVLVAPQLVIVILGGRRGDANGGDERAHQQRPPDAGGRGSHRVRFVSWLLHRRTSLSPPPSLPVRAREHAGAVECGVERGRVIGGDGGEIQYGHRDRFPRPTQEDYVPAAAREPVVTVGGE